MEYNNLQVDWNKYAEQYDAITMSGTNPAYIGLVKKVINHFEDQDIKKDSLIIDLGGGTGNFTLGALTNYWINKGIPSIAERNPHSHFLILDGSEKMLELAEEKKERLKLKNVEVVKGDVEKINELSKKYSRHFDHALMMHCLYATRSQEDPKKPQRVLNNIYQNLKEKGSFFISDINKPLKTETWIPYCLANAMWRFKSFKK
ncbi:MAG: class I SAM-dependent methyltransferase, partial [bacterium]